MYKRTVNVQTDGLLQPLQLLLLLMEGALLQFGLQDLLLLQLQLVLLLQLPVPAERGKSEDEKWQVQFKKKKVFLISFL